MNFEQPASLNRFVADPMPLTWAKRWQFIQFGLPIAIFGVISNAQIIFVKMENGQWNEWEPSRIAGMLVVPFLIIGGGLLVYEQEWRRAHRSKRFLNIVEKGICFNSANRLVIPWSKVGAFWFESVPGEFQLSKVTVLYFRRRKTSQPIRRSFVLEKGTQVQLIQELNYFRQKYHLDLQIETTVPLPPRPTLPPGRLQLGLYAFFAGLLLLLNGSGFLLTSLPPRFGEFRFPVEIAILNAFAAHFTSKTEFSMFSLVTGVTLTLTGVPLLIYGDHLLKVKAEEAPKMAA